MTSAPSTTKALLKIEFANIGNYTIFRECCFLLKYTAVLMWIYVYIALNNQDMERFFWCCGIIFRYALLSSEISGWWHLTLKPSNFGKASSISIFARLGLSPKATDQIAKPCVIRNNSNLAGWDWIHFIQMMRMFKMFVVIMGREKNENLVCGQILWQLRWKVKVWDVFAFCEGLLPAWRRK